MYIHIEALSKEKGSDPSGFTIMLYQKDEKIGHALFKGDAGVGFIEARAMIITVLSETLCHRLADISVNPKGFDFGPGVSLIKVEKSNYSISEIQDHIAEWLDANAVPGIPRKLPPKPYQPGVKSRRT